jgi:hypothetical protein
VIGRRRPGGQSGPPEGLLSFEGNITPGQANVMEIAGRPVGQFTPRPVTLMPDVEGLADLLDQPGYMMICHRIISVSRHFQLLELNPERISSCECTSTNDNLYPFA